MGDDETGGTSAAAGGRPGPLVAFFGHDVNDSAVRRRVRSLADDGCRIVGFMMRRRDGGEPEWENVELGRTQDAAYLRRVVSMFLGSRAAGRGDAARRLRSADLLWARNLDMLACALLARRRLGLTTPVVYECLDVHDLTSRAGLVGRLFRAVEGRLLRQTAGLVVSSPAFLRNHFERHHAGLFRPYLVENRLVAGTAAARPSRSSAGSRSATSAPLRIGWVGILRCKRSLDLLCAIADRFPDEVEIRLHGIPSRTEIPVFEPLIERRENMVYAGAYRAPEDLPAIYGELDLVWAGDFMDAGFNSVWLLPNRLYEGGWFATPAVAPAGTETAAWIDRHHCGLSVPEPLESTLPALVEKLLTSRQELDRSAEALLALPDEVFVQPPGFLADVVNSVLGDRVPLSPR